MKHFIQVALMPCFLSFMVILGGCVTASQQANANAAGMVYHPIDYANADKPGPTVIVLPGKMKSSSSTFIQKYDANNIADFGEIELGNDNFRVLERAALGPMLNEVKLAVSMGDSSSLAKFKKGKFKTTKWFIQFDILKAEQVSKVENNFAAGALGSIAGMFIGGRAGATTSIAAHSTEVGEGAGVWIVGLRYKIIDAATSEQVSSKYFEDTMEIGNHNIKILGASTSSAGGITLDDMIQRLVQKAVADIDRKK
jgi:hypothetical protein